MIDHSIMPSLMPDGKRVLPGPHLWVGSEYDAQAIGRGFQGAT